MSDKLFVRLYKQKKRKINISIDSDLKAELTRQKLLDGISISEKVEKLYRHHKKLIENVSVPNHGRNRGERGKPMYGDRIRETIGIFLTPNAIAFFDGLAKEKNSDRSQIIEAAIIKVYKSL